MNLKKSVDFDSLTKILKNYCPEIIHEYIENLSPIPKDSIEEHFIKLFEIMNIYSEKGSVTSRYTKKIPGLERLNIDNFILSIDAIIAIKENLLLIKELKQFFNKVEQFPALKKMISQLFYSKDLILKINFVFNEYGEIKDTASNELKKIRKHLKELKNNINNLYKKIFKNPVYNSMIREHIITIKNNRHVIPIKKEFKNRFPGIIHGESNTLKTIFMEPIDALNINNEINNLINLEKKEIEKILRELTYEIKKNTNELLNNQNILKYWEYLAGLSRFCFEKKAIIPKINYKNTIILKECIHPLLDSRAIPQDIIMEEEIKLLVFSGPNAGGKSVALKTIGLWAYAFKCGIPIISKSATLPYFDKILIDIGDQQSIENNLSTFTGHIKNICYILKNTNHNSLILIDEIGVGSSPEESEALAVGILHELLKKNAKIAVTTHYKKVIEFAENNIVSKNASLEFDIKNLKPLFKIYYNKPGFSYGVLIAEKYGIPREVIKKANSVLEKSFVDYRNLLIQLRKKEDELNILQKKLDKKSNSLKTLENELKNYKNELKNKIKKQMDKLIEKKQNELDNILNELRLELKNVIKEKGKNEHKLREKIKKISLQLSNSNEKIRNLNIKIGDYIKIKGANDIFKVIEKKGDKLLIKNNKFSINCKIKKVTEIVNEPIRKTKSINITSDIIFQKRLTFSNTIDVRGKKSDETIELISHFISDALAIGEKRVSIIHGIGELKLKDAVWKYIKENFKIKRIYHPPHYEGGIGKTIIEF